jgi:predicted anti-sigma-YlaC factor YlaD
MNCEKFEELLPLYAEDALSGGDLRTVEDHLAACGACRASLALYEELEAQVG